MSGQQLEYEERGGLGDSAWSLVGFSLALVLALFSAWSWWGMWRSVRGGATAYSFGVTPLYYVVAAAVAAACMVGMGRGRRRFALIGLVIAVASAVAIGALVWGSPWSPPRPIAASAPGASSASGVRAPRNLLRPGSARVSPGTDARVRRLSGRHFAPHRRTGAADAAVRPPGHAAAGT